MEFKDILSLMRNGTLTIKKYEFLIIHFLSEINEKNKYILNEIIHLVTQWKHNTDPKSKYLNMLCTLVSKIILQYKHCMISKGANHCLKEYNFPSILKV